jgi:hypothetical protein
MRDAKAYLEDSFLHINANAFSIHTSPSFADEPQLEIDANLLACFFSELISAASLIFSHFRGRRAKLGLTAYIPRHKSSRLLSL